MTYRGHAVLQTLIRAYFSPGHTTGQRYIYAGNAEGDILVWDVVSGKQVGDWRPTAAEPRQQSPGSSNAVAVPPLLLLCPLGSALGSVCYPPFANPLYRCWLLATSSSGS